MRKGRRSLDWYRKVAADKAAGKRAFIHCDPGMGLEVNTLQMHYKVCSKIWNVDLARSPNIIKSLGEQVDIHHKGWNANGKNPLVNYKIGRVDKGRKVY